MPTLIACLSSGKGTWTEVTNLIKSGNWTKVFLITDEFGKDKFTLQQENVNFILVNSFSDLALVKEQIKNQLKNQITDFEVGLNFVSGSGKEHMAMLEAILELGFNFRLVTVQDQKIKILGLDTPTS